MAKNRPQPREPREQPLRQELSPEQRLQMSENRLREEDPIDNRKTDGPNVPSV